MTELFGYMLGMWTPGPIEIIIIGIIALLIFGKRLPQMARGLGASFIEFKKGLKEADNAKEDIVSEVKNVTGLDEQEDIVSEIKNATGLNEEENSIG